MTKTPQIFYMTSSSNFFDVALFLLLSLVTGRSFISISSLLLELWQFSFIKDWPEIQTLETPPSEFLLNIWRLGRVRDTKFGTNVSNKMLWMLQNAKVTAFIVSELLRENQQGVGGKITTPTQIKVKLSDFNIISLFFKHFL